MRTPDAVRFLTKLVLLLTVIFSGCARHTPYWLRVQAVAPQTKTWVRLYENEAPRGEQKIKGRLHSVAADSITLNLKDGQMRTLQKQAVRKVLIRRPFAKRWPGWAALGIAFTLVELFYSTEYPSFSGRLVQQHAVLTSATAAAFFHGSRMKGIYEIPPKLRTQSPGTP